MLSAAAATGSYLGTLAFFLIITFIAVYLNKSLYTGDMEKRTETYVAARNTQGSLAIALSFFASGAGAWVLFTIPEAAILGGPVALIGYTVSSLIPVAIIGCMGPYMRRNLPMACTFFEYIQARYGTVVNVYCTLVSLFSLLLYMSAEFTSVGSCVVALSELTSPLGPVISTSVVTVLYTSIGGLPVSLFTDKVQGVGILVFTVLVCVAAFGFYELPTRTNDEAVIANWKIATTWGIGGTATNAFKMAFILILAVTPASLMHSGYQQRIWAAQGDAQVRNGAIGGILLTIPFMALFGVLGMISFANYGVDGLVAVGPDETYLGFLAAFFLIGAMPVAWQVRGRRGHHTVCSFPRPRPFTP
jgi:Na+/proline symporter